MRVFLLAASCLVLAGCQKPAAPPAAPVSTVAPVTAEDGWNGKYEGDKLRVEITGKPGMHRVMLLTATQDCTGDIGLADGGVAASAEDSSALDIALDTDGKGECDIAISRDGNTLTSSETVECARFHGATCSFNGKTMRVSHH